MNRRPTSYAGPCRFQPAFHRGSGRRTDLRSLCPGRHTPGEAPRRQRPLYIEPSISSRAVVRLTSSNIRPRGADRGGHVITACRSLQERSFLSDTGRSEMLHSRSGLSRRSNDARETAPGARFKPAHSVPEWSKFLGDVYLDRRSTRISPHGEQAGCRRFQMLRHRGD